MRPNLKLKKKIKKRVFIATYRLVNWSVDRLISWPVGRRLASRLVGRLVSWLIGRMDLPLAYSDIHPFVDL